MAKTSKKGQFFEALPQLVLQFIKKQGSSLKSRSVLLQTINGAGESISMVHPKNRFKNLEKKGTIFGSFVKTIFSVKQKLRPYFEI